MLDRPGERPIALVALLVIEQDEDVRFFPQPIETATTAFGRSGFGTPQLWGAMERPGSKRSASRQDGFEQRTTAPTRHRSSGWILCLHRNPFLTIQGIRFKGDSCAPGMRYML